MEIKMGISNRTVSATYKKKPNVFHLGLSLTTNHTNEAEVIES